MARDRDTARERNARIRKEQQKLSEERRLRSLRTEDFQAHGDTSDFVRFHSITEPSTSEIQREPRSRKQSASRKTSSSRTRTRTVTAKKRTRQEAPTKKSVFSAAAIPLTARHESDFSLIASIILLSFIGLVMVTSSSYYYAYNTFGDSLYFFRKQLLFLVLGTAALVVCMNVPLQWYKRFAWAAYLAAIVCLVAVLFIGIEVKGSKRWLGVGSFSFQPTELAKLSVALFMAVKVDQHRKTIKSARTFFMLLAILAVPTGLVLYQNLSSGIIVGMIGLVIMFVGGCKFRYFMILGAIALAFFGIFVVLPSYVPLDAFPGFMQGFIEDFMYRSNRVEAFLDPFAYAQSTGYQTVQSLYAVGSGGFFGLGLGESIQKLGFIPEAHNDIIFAIICEELGLFGATIVILLFGIMLKQGIQIAMDAPDRFTTYAATGLISQIGIQAIMNIAVNTNSIPATGVSLPFISYGGSSFLFLMGSMGILLNISKYTRETDTLQAVYE